MSGRPVVGRTSLMPAGADSVYAAVGGTDGTPTLADIVGATDLDPHRARRAQAHLAESGTDDAPTFDDIVEETGLEPHQARRAVMHLVESGDLSVHRQPGPGNTVTYTTV